jgi:hypothetical protein
MVFDMPWLVKCPHCKALLWIDEQERVAEIDHWSDYKSAKSYYDPELQDYLNALKKEGLSIKKRRYLHLHAWWKGNDQKRNDPLGKPDLSAVERDNLETFYRILDPAKIEERVIMAEIKRELGEFEAAVALLDKPDPKGHAWLLNYIKELAQKRISHVSKLDFDTYNKLATGERGTPLSYF